MRHEAMFTLKNSPPGAMLMAWLAGISINEWAAFAGLVYTVCLIGEKVWKWRQAWLAKRRK